MYVKNVSLKKAACFLVIPILYFFLPAYFSSRFIHRPFLALFLFYCANLILITIMVRRSSARGSQMRFRHEELEGKVNLQTEQNAEGLVGNVALKEKITRYSSLKKVVEAINQEFDPDAVCGHLCSSAFSMVAQEKGTCILYTADRQSHTLHMFKVCKEDPKLIIKAKQGDIFDQWVLMHMSALHISDIRTDFRFDLDTVTVPDSRAVGSLISAPLVSGGRFLGMLRLDHPEAGFYTLDDLRFLTAMCDLGALALENAFLYRDTQELAVTDGLTSAFTKGHFLELLKLECRRSLRSTKPFTLLMLDIDYFKRYNDSFGHIAGDIVLKNLCSRIEGMLRERGALLARFGGEEFCVILPGADRALGLETAELLREQIEREKIILRRKATGVTVSIGCAVFPQDGSDETELLLKVDKAMYAAKQGGRNRVYDARRVK